mgnify:CR=1 FL=1
MIKFIKPTNLNGSELLEELNAAGVKIEEKPYIDTNGDLWLDIASKDEANAKSIVDSHNGTIVAPELSSKEQVLNKLGLTAEEVAALLS